jgi:hypothetical protein
MIIDYTKISFWKEYPELSIAPGLDKLYKKDTSKDKMESSLLMWAIHLCESLESKYYSNPNKYETIAKTILKDEKYNWKKYNDIIDFYKECCLTDAERALTLWNDTMRLRSISLKEMYQAAFDDNDTDELVKLDKMLSTTSKMFDDYKKIKADYEAEKTQKKGKGNSSMSDADDL